MKTKINANQYNSLRLSLLLLNLFLVFIISLENLTIEFPKPNLAIIENNLILDTTKVNIPHVLALSSNSWFTIIAIMYIKKRPRNWNTAIFINWKIEDL